MVVAGRLFAGTTLSSLLIMGLVLVPFPTGWEVGIAITGLREANIIFTANCKGYAPVDLPGLRAGELSRAVLFDSNCPQGANSWVIDTDSPNSGRPTLLITTQQPRHTDAGGEPTDHDRPADSRTVTRQRDTFYIDRHIFMFEFQVVTEADVAKKNCYLVEGCSFDHETSAFVPNFTTDVLRGTLEVSNNGQPFEGSSLIFFRINPWQGIRQPADGTIRFDQWVGIMQATVFRVEAGKVPNAPGSQDFPWAVETLLSIGAQPNMYVIEGDVAQQINDPGSVPLDARIPSGVLVELPYKLTVGAAKESNSFGNFRGIAPINVFAKYVVRMDVAIVTGFTPQLDYVDANNNRVLDTGEFTFIDKNQDNAWTPLVDEAVSGTPPVADTGSLEQPAPPPSGLQTGCPPNCPVTIQPPPDIFFPSCNFFDFECRLRNWSLFPADLGLAFALLLPIIAIVAIVFIAMAFVGVARRRGR